MEKSKTGRANINFYNCDNMAHMKSKPDNYYDLAIVDPPYGIDVNHNIGRRKGEKQSGNKKFTWDNSIPSEEYFIEMQRVSKNQIIWGGNYFANLLDNSRCWIYWRKLMGGDFSDGELAWTSFDKVIREYTLCPKAGKSIHPTQKPVKLYEWLLHNYAKQGNKILDTHGGSASIALACWNLGFDLDLCELDPDYFNDSWQRFEIHTQQGQLF